MNKDQLNRYGMLKSTQDYLDSKTAIWSVIPKIVAYKNELDEIITTTGEKSEEARAGTSTRERKDQVKEHIALKVSTLTGTLQAFGHEKGMPDLASKASVSKSDVLKYTDAELDSHVKALISLAQENLAGLADYGVSEALITEILSSVDEFNGLIGKPRAIRSSKFTANHTASQLVDEGVDLLNNKVDKLMLMFRESQPEFYEGYLRARTIVDR